MKPQFAHYWQEGVILNEEEREHQHKIAQAMNQGFVYTVPEGSPLNGHVSTALSKSELKEMMLARTRHTITLDAILSQR